MLYLPWFFLPFNRFFCQNVIYKMLPWQKLKGILTGLKLDLPGLSEAIFVSYRWKNFKKNLEKEFTNLLYIYIYDSPVDLKFYYLKPEIPKVMAASKCIQLYTCSAICKHIVYTKVVGIRKKNFFWNFYLVPNR